MESKERLSNFEVQILKKHLKMIHVMVCFENGVAVEVMKVMQQ